VIECVGEQSQDVTRLRDGEKELTIQLFDDFYYHPEIHTVLRHSAAPTVYALGDVLPLNSASFSYPSDFDLPAGSEFANIRCGVFAGFGERDPKYPLLDTKGIELETKPPRDFGKYRRVTVWEKDYEI
jgi:sulfate adenylyltransferase subunit 1